MRKKRLRASRGQSGVWNSRTQSGESVSKNRFDLICGHGRRLCDMSFSRLCRMRLGLQPLPYLRQRCPGSDFASPYELSAVLESVVLVSVDIGLKHEIRGPLPLRAIHLLRNRKALADHVE